VAANAEQEITIIRVSGTPFAVADLGVLRGSIDGTVSEIRFRVPTKCALRILKFRQPVPIATEDKVRIGSFHLVALTLTRNGSRFTFVPAARDNHGRH
jgi:hypothetical protein